MTKEEIDVHGLDIINAKNAIIKTISNAYKCNVSVVYVIHGFNSGTKIKNWCLNEGTNLDYVIKVEPGENEGITKFFIKLNLF